MKVIELKNIVRKDVPIYYRRLYTAKAVMEFLSKQEEISLHFQIEHKPTGQIEITITAMDNVDYPLVPLQKELKNFIGDLDSHGKLPS